MGKFEDLTGQKFGKLTVISRTANIGRKVAWNCLCDCDTKTVVMTFNLKNGSTVSCGCYRKEVFLNTYEIVSNEYVIGFTNKGVSFYIDVEDYEKVKNYVWYENSEGYITTNKKENKTISMQRFLMNPSENLQVDHIDRKEKNNRRNNLRICTNAVNAKNRGIYENNKSGYIGVWLHEKTNKWKSYITVDGKRIHLGTYINIDEAVKVRQEAEEIYFGEYQKQ